MPYVISTAALFFLLNTSGALGSVVHEGESIQAAIDAARPGDLIEVENGTYIESIVVDKPVALHGEGYPIIDANGNCTAVILSAEGSSIEGFCIMNSGLRGSCDNHGGIFLNSSSNTIRSNRIINNTYGICIDSSGNNTIVNNTVNGSIFLGFGITINDCQDNLIEDNDISNNQAVGIVLSNSTENILRGNRILHNGGAFPHLGEFQYMASGICFLYDSRNNTFRENEIYGNYVNFGFFDPAANDMDSSNLVEGKPLRILKGVSGVTINSSNDAGLLFCLGCSNISVEGLEMTNNTGCIWLENTTDSAVSGCLLKNSTAGIFLDEKSTNVTLKNNTIEDCLDGISLSGRQNTIASNSIERCLKGISVVRHRESTDYEAAEANRIEGNIVVDGIVGIDLSFGSGNIMENNSMDGNLINLDPGRRPFESINEIGPSNLVNKRKVYWLRDVADVTLNSSSDAGMVICTNASNLTLCNLDLERSRSGIDVYNATNLTISDCTIRGCENGIAISNSRNCSVEGNAVSNNGDGIAIIESAQIILEDNIVRNISRSRWISEYRSSSNLSKRLLYNIGLLGYSLNSGLWIVESHNVRLINNTVNYSEECGIILSESENCTLSGSFTANNSVGLDLLRSNNNTLTDNRAKHNEYGLRLQKSRGNRIYSNTLTDNQIANAFDEEGSNFWDSGAVGNYYGNINCTDLDQDGVCESSYPISGGSSVDRYPLREFR